MSRLSWGGVLAALGALGIAAFCVRLGFWQLDRLDQRREYNASVERAAEQPPLDLSGGRMLDAGTYPDDYLYRPAIATGAYIQSADLLLRGRSHLGTPGVHLVSLFQLDDGGEILVNRGWLPAPDGATVDPRPYRVTGPQRLTGSLQAVPEDIEGATPLRIQLDDGTTVPTFLRLDRTTLSRELDTAIPPLYLQLTGSPSEADLPIAVPPSDLDEGPHLGYAIQWFSFAAIAFFGFFFVLLGGPGRLRSRRFSDEEPVVRPL